MLEAVIFDMDGVILDSEPIHHQVEANIIKRFGVDFQFQEHTTYVGQKTIDLWKGLSAKYELPVAAELLADEDHRDYLHELKHGNHEPIDGVVDLIQELFAAKVPLIVASSAVRNNIDVVLDRFQIRQYFQGYVSGQDVLETKPNPEIFLKAAEFLGVNPENSVVIEDAKHGVKAAKAANMQCVGYQNDNSGQQDLSQSDLIVTSMKDLTLKKIQELTTNN